MADPIKINDEATCEECGRYGAFEMGGRRLCESCYQISGTCGSGDQGGEEEE
jgi:hypothetical protein